ncbi:MAG: nucleoside 2-deoxyribosyltransferase [Gaiellaceae bacterium]
MSRVYLAGPPYADEYRRRATKLVTEAGWEAVDPMRRDFRGRSEGHEVEIVESDLAEIRSCDVVIAAFIAPDEGTAMEAWYAHTLGKPVVAYTAGTPPHPWTVYVSHAVCADLEDSVRAVAETLAAPLPLSVAQIAIKKGGTRFP